MMTKKEFDDIIVSYGLKIDPESPDMAKMPGICNFAFRYYDNGSEIWSALKILYNISDNTYCFCSWEKDAISGVKSLTSKIREFQETYKKLVKEHRFSKIREL